MKISELVRNMYMLVSHSTSCMSFLATHNLLIWKKIKGLGWDIRSQWVPPILGWRQSRGNLRSPSVYTQPISGLYCSFVYINYVAFLLQSYSDQGKSRITNCLYLNEDAMLLVILKHLIVLALNKQLSEFILRNAPSGVTPDTFHCWPAKFPIISGLEPDSSCRREGSPRGCPYPDIVWSFPEPQLNWK